MKVIFPWFLKELKPNWTGHYMQKAKAKARAKAAGRPYPNLVDNAAVKRKAK